MSGAEVVGLVLGVLPLIVSAVENYEAAFRPFLTFSRYCNELRDFRTDFATQRQLFQNHCLILLASQIDSDEAEEILRSGANPKWRVDKLGEKELALETKLKSYLGQNLETCVSLIIRIEETLMTIQEKTNGLNDEASNVSPGLIPRFASFHRLIFISQVFIDWRQSLAPRNTTENQILLL